MFFRAVVEWFQFFQDRWENVRKRRLLREISAMKTYSGRSQISRGKNRWSNIGYSMSFRMYAQCEWKSIFHRWNLAKQASFSDIFSSILKKLKSFNDSTKYHEAPIHFECRFTIRNTFWRKKVSRFAGVGNRICLDASYRAYRAGKKMVELGMHQFQLTGTQSDWFPVLTGYQS